MAFAFLKFLKRQPKVESLPTPVVTPVEKSSADKFAKTVMPNATRAVAAQDPFQLAARTTPAVIAPSSASAPRAISFAPAATAPQADLPPAVALAIAPNVERTISLELSDIVSQIPEGFAKPIATLDLSRRVLLNAADLEKGMAGGRPTIALASIYDQMPEVFVRPVAADDATRVRLPFSKVLEQFSAVQVRRDQERQHVVPQVETPFLQVTLEDNERFGTSMDHVETDIAPPVKMQPATAEVIAAAEPEPQEKIQGPALPSLPPTAEPAPASTPVPAPVRIPFKLSPNGTDASANESVPASGGPSVPLRPLEAPITAPTSAKPARIPFKLAPIDEPEKPKTVEPWLTAENFGVAPKSTAAPVAKPKDSGAKIQIGLKATLQTLPACQLKDDVSSVPADVRVELPFNLIEPQLANGRITIAAKTFAAAIPTSFRSLFDEAGADEVVLPLQEVLTNLPVASLRMRDDQFEQEIGEQFATPFSTTAEEDAKRFSAPPLPVPKPIMVAPVEKQPETKLQAPAVESPAANAEVESAKATPEKIRTPLQVALDTDEKLDAKTVVSQINRMAGVKASAIMFSDGLSLAGDLPKDLATDGLCAVAPSLLQRVENHTLETKLGAFRGLTLNCANGTISFFMHDNLCLAALHANGELAADTRQRLGRVVHELSRKYSHPV